MKNMIFFRLKEKAHCRKKGATEVREEHQKGHGLHNKFCEVCEGIKKRNMLRKSTYGNIG